VRCGVLPHQYIHAGDDRPRTKDAVENCKRRSRYVMFAVSCRNQVERYKRWGKVLKLVNPRQRKMTRYVVESLFGYPANHNLPMCEGLSFICQETVESPGAIHFETLTPRKIGLRDRVCSLFPEVHFDNLPRRKCVVFAGSVRKVVQCIDTDEYAVTASPGAATIFAPGQPAH
jgi:hypothetical protein